MKKFISGFMILFLTMIVSLSANAAPGDLFVQLDLEAPLVGNDQCSILKVMPDGIFSEFVSFPTILALTGLDDCDMDDTGIAVARNGEVYFSEDQSDSVIKATPAGALSTFVTEAQIIAVTLEGSANLSNGMVIGPDGGLCFNDRISNSILKATIPGGVVSLEVSEAQVQAVTGFSTVNLQGGIAFDCAGNLYITDNPGITEEDRDSILVLTPEGTLSIFVSEQEINAATGFNSTDLDTGMTFFGDSLYVNDDGACDCVLKITLDGGISVLVSEAQITAATDNGGADLEGGIALNQRAQVFIGDDGDNPDDSNLLMSTSNGSSVSLFITTQELEDFFPGFDQPRLEGSIAFEGVDACIVADIPTLSEWGLIAMAGILGIAGFIVIVIRRRKVTA
ncbi:MAG: IPTL-CTERM sorting domain-containing protein [Candidatus Dadabacteria bacterium]|nr:IPTL-CTERM sorting domain-containing protein [Candidatus Dadabacteria bacterium]